MNLGGQRQHPRVQLDTAVRVRRGVDGPWLQARALDLSEGGVRVQVHEGMPIGSEVRCSLPLLGARGSDLELTGTVAWVEGSAERPDTKTLVRLGGPDGHAHAHAHDGHEDEHLEARLERRSMGLRFSPLPAADAERVRSAVRGAAAQPCDVVLALEGRSEPVTARAEPTADGLLLRAPLPVVRVGAAVGVRFASDGESVVGVVKSVSLGSQAGAPELRIELGRGDPNAVPGPSTGESAERTSGSSGALLNPAADDDAERESEPGPRRGAAYDPDATVEVFVPMAPRSGASTGFVVVVALVCLALGAVIGVGLAQRLPEVLIGRPNQAKARAVPPRPVAPPTALPGVVSPAAAQLPPSEAALAPSTQTGLPTQDAPTLAEPAAAREADPVASPVVGVTASAAEPAAVPSRAGPGASPAAVADPPPDEASESVLAAAGQGLQVSTLGRVTRVRIPITGDTQDMRVYDLSSPGLTVNLPAATTPVRLGNFAVNTGLARRVWLRKLDTGLQVRVIYNRGAVRPEVSADNGALTIDLSL
jgi:hypothetical protein